MKIKQNQLSNKIKKRLRLNCGRIISCLMQKDESEEGIFKPTCDPEFIIWRNLGIDDIQRKLKLVRNIFVLMVIVIITNVSIDLIKGFRGSLFAKYLPELQENGLQGIKCN